MVSTRLFALVSLLPLALVACGGDDDPAAGGTTDAGVDATPADGSQPDTLETDGAPDAPAEVGADTPAPDAPDLDGAVCSLLESVTGGTVSEQGAPLPDVFAVLCVYLPNGSASCLNPKKTDSNGSFTIVVPVDKQCVDRAAYQLRAPDDLTLTQVYCPVHVGSGGAVTISQSDRLIHAPAPTRDPLGVETEPHLIAEPGGARMTVVPGDLFLFDFTYDDLRLLTWDDAAWGWPCFVDTANPPDGLVAFVPEVELTSKNAAHIAFPNTKSLAPGTVVDLWALGGAVSKRWDGTTIHEGSFEVAGEAVVSADGQWIETRPDEGVPFMTWVGWKQK